MYIGNKSDFRIKVPIGIYVRKINHEFFKFREDFSFVNEVPWDCSNSSSCPMFLLIEVINLFSAENILLYRDFDFLCSCDILNKIA